MCCVFILFYCCYWTKVKGNKVFRLYVLSLIVRMPHRECSQSNLYVKLNCSASFFDFSIRFNWAMLLCRATLQHTNQYADWWVLPKTKPYNFSNILQIWRFQKAPHTNPRKKSTTTTSTSTPTIITISALFFYFWCKQFHSMWVMPVHSPSHGIFSKQSRYTNENQYKGK